MWSNRLQHRNTSSRIVLCSVSKNTTCFMLPKSEKKQNISNTFKRIRPLMTRTLSHYTHFEPFVVESGGELGVRAQEIFKKICNLITQSTGQSGSSIAYFWKSRLLVTLAKITHSNALRWAMAHNEPRNPDSIPIDFTDCYDDDTHETRRMIHSSGMECGRRRGEAEINSNWPMTR